MDTTKLVVRGGKLVDAAYLHDNGTDDGETHVRVCRFQQMRKLLRAPKSKQGRWACDCKACAKASRQGETKVNYLTNRDGDTFTIGCRTLSVKQIRSLMPKPKRQVSHPAPYAHGAGKRKKAKGKRKSCKRS